jgi:hypothetical protein
MKSAPLVSSQFDNIRGVTVSSQLGRFTQTSKSVGYLGPRLAVNALNANILNITQLYHAIQAQQRNIAKKDIAYRSSPEMYRRMQVKHVHFQIEND